MHEQSLITDTLNKHFGNLATQILHAVHVQPYDPHGSDTRRTFAMEILVLGLLLIFFFWSLFPRRGKYGTDTAAGRDASSVLSPIRRFDHRPVTASAMSCSPLAC